MTSPDTVQIQEGDMAPAVMLELDDGSTAPLASFRGRHVALYFYPKDDTPGCTVEAKGIRDAWDEFRNRDVLVYGVSTQDAASHQAFIEKYHLPFRLVVDADEKVARAFGVPVKNGYTARQTVLVGPDGAVKKIWRDVDPLRHADDLLAACG